MGGATTQAIQRAARRDLGFACLGGRREMGISHEAVKDLGKEPARYSVVASRVVYIAAREDQAWNEAGPALRYQAEL